MSKVSVTTGLSYLAPAVSFDPAYRFASGHKLIVRSVSAKSSSKLFVVGHDVIVELDEAAVENGGVFEQEQRAAEAAGEEGDAFAEEDGVHGDRDFVEQALLEERPDEFAATDEPDSSALVFG